MATPNENQSARDYCLSYGTREAAQKVVNLINYRINHGVASKEDKALLDAIVPFLEVQEGWSGPDAYDRAFAAREG